MGFNPRTHEGCDALHQQDATSLSSFNPRTHEGCDPIKTTRCVGFKVSIHAPTRGATNFRLPSPAM